MQQILPRSGTAWQSQNPAPAEPDQPAGDEQTSAPAPAPTAEGVGKLVDKTV